MDEASVKGHFLQMIGLAVLALVIGGCETNRITKFDNNFSIGGDDKLIAFVGRKVALKEFDPSRDDPKPMNEDEIIIHMDSAFEARYEILELVHGKYGEKLIDFEVYDHNGFPKFAKRDIAMLYVGELDGRLVHKKYQWDRVHRTKEGRYAYCGDPYYFLDEGERADVTPRPLQAIDFDPPVVIRISDELIPRREHDEYTDEEIEANRRQVSEIYAPPAFGIRNGIATCKMGVYPEELFRIKNETEFRPRERRRLCNIEVGFLPSDWNDPVKRQALEECLFDKKNRGIP